MNEEKVLRLLISQLIIENWEEQYKTGSNADDFGFDDDSKTLYEPKKTKKKIKNYLTSMGLLSKKK